MLLIDATFQLLVCFLRAVVTLLYSLLVTDLSALHSSAGPAKVEKAKPNMLHCNLN